MYNFEVYPIIDKNNPNLYGLFVVNTKGVTEIARYDIENDEIILKDAISNGKKFSLNKVIGDFIKECLQMEELKKLGEELIDGSEKEC